jgi:coenzyme F420-reducing hydrogenase delta subunit
MISKNVKIVVYHCRNLQLFKDEDQKAFTRSRPGIKLVTIPCSGKIEAHHLLKTLAGGAQGVLVLACAEQACKFLEGSSRSGKRAEYAQSWLNEIGIATDRIRYIRAKPRDVEALDEMLRDFGVKLDSLDPLPAAAIPV